MCVINERHTIVHEIFFLINSFRINKQSHSSRKFYHTDKFYYIIIIIIKCEYGKWTCYLFFKKKRRKNVIKKKFKRVWQFLTFSTVELEWWWWWSDVNRRKMKRHTMRNHWYFFWTINEANLINYTTFEHNIVKLMTKLLPAHMYQVY